MGGIFVTGGAGFIGSNFVRYWLSRYPDDSVVNYDLLTYAGNPDNLADVTETYPGRYEFVQGDIGNYELTRDLLERHRPDCVVNFAAESHNSRAVVNPDVFFETNVLGTQRLLQAAHDAGVPRVHHISTCEVYGDLPLDSDESFSETAPYQPRTPYNASKAAADLAVRAYHLTFGLPVTISNCANNYGPPPVPGKGGPSVCHPAPQREEDDALQEQPEQTGVAPRGRPLPGDRPDPEAGEDRGDVQCRQRR